MNLAEAVCGYAARLHRAIGPVHHVASPLGAWLVLALAAPAAPDRARLADVLGCEPDEAAAAARALLDHPHTVVRLAAAAWHAVDTPALTEWLAHLGRTEHGAIPTAAEADAWATDNTGGLIERFPIDIDADTLLVLASAVACVISWRKPFGTADAAELALPRGPGFEAIRTMLRTPSAAAEELIVDSPAAGLIATHSVASTDSDLLVVSVIADPWVPAEVVLDRAHEIAVARALGRPIVGATSLFDLPLGVAHAWTLTETTITAPRDQERFESRLPAWSAQSTHELTKLDGFPEAGAGLAALLPESRHNLAIEARQVAMARYTRTGFQAAAVTAMGFMAAARRSREARLRTAAVEYTHPYAVVAVAVADAPSPWAGVPLFSAWVTQGDEA